MTNTLVLTCLIAILRISFTCAQQEYTLILSERSRTDGQTTIRSIPADPKTYIDSGTVPSNVLFQQSNGFWTRLASDYNSDRIIWSDASLKLLWRGNISQPQATPLYSGSSNAVGGISIDWMTGNVYWSDDNYNWIMLHDQNGNTKVLIDTELEAVGGVAVYPESGYLYWTNRGTRPRIERSNLAGENRQLVATANVRSPHGIVVDHTSQRIYWTDYDGALSTLESCDLNGNDRFTVFSLPGTEGIFQDLAIFQNYIYITDWTDQLRCILKEEHEQYFTLSLQAQPLGITAFVPATSSHVELPCGSNPCEHICVGDGYNSFKCICRDGFTLHQDGTRCIKDEIIAPPIVIIAFKTKICWYPGTFPDMRRLDSYTESCLLNAQGFTAAIAVDEDKNLLFYSDIQTKSINRVLLKNNSTVEELIGATGSVEGLSVDWLSQNIYWTDNHKGHIAVSRYDGRFFKVLIDGISTPRSIAVDPHERIFFWTQFGPPAEINRANLDGSDQVTIAYNRILYPSGLAADYASKRLYFADTGYGAIQVVDYDGQNREIFAFRRGKEFFDMTIFKDYLLWTEWKTSNGVHVLNKETKEIANFRSHNMPNDESIYGIASFSKHRQRDGNGPCGTNNGGCEQLCLPSGPLGSFVCACTTGYELHEDGTTCTSDPVSDNFILLTDTYLHGIFQLDMTKQTPEVLALPLGHLSAPLGVTYDPVEEKVYWSDTQENVVMRARLNGEQKEVIIGGSGEVNVFKPHSLAIETSAMLVFWTDIIQHSIMVCRLDGTRKKTLISEDLQYPRDIAISSGRGTGYIFWSAWGEAARIEMSYMDGSGRRLIANESLGWPYSLTVDVSESYLYWTDAMLHTIEVSDFLGLTRRTLLNLGEKSHPFGIVIYGRALYWSDWRKGGLSHINIQQKYPNDDDIEVFDVEPAQFTRPNYAHAFTKAAENTGNNICVVNNGGCSGLCLPVGFSRTCACADGVELKSDLTTCVADTEESLCPDKLLNGELEEGCSLIPGVRCSYRCYEGYHTAYSDILCLSTGFWHKKQSPFCEDTGESLCPDKLLNGELEEGCSLIPGVRCSYRCYEGYHTTYSDILCLSTGFWDEKQSPLCEDTEVQTKPDNSGIQPTGPSLQPTIAFTTKPENLTPELGGTDIVQRCVTNDSNAEITWYKGGHNLPSASIQGVFIMASGHLLISEVREHHAGIYTCRAQIHGSPYFIEANAHLVFKPDTIFQVKPENATVDSGDDHVIQCATNTPTYIVEWEKNGVKIKYKETIHKVPTTDSLLIRKVIPFDSGRYTCVVYSFDRTRIAEASAEIIVNPSEEPGNICGTVTGPQAVLFHATNQEDRQEGRIVKGRTSVSGAAPWMARLWSRSKRTHYCGGNLLNREWILTAGHCIKESNVTKDDLVIRLGDFDNMSPETSEQMRAVSKIKVHHKFDVPNFDRDIALVKLARPVEEFTDFIRPICLLNATCGNAIYIPGVTGLVVGWGRVAEDGHYARYMKQVKVPIRGQNVCQSSTPYKFTKNMFCAGNPNSQGDACDGDSGGPLAVMVNGRWHLAGLVSWGEGCAREGQYGFYTKVSRFYNWIQAQINKG